MVDQPVFCLRTFLLLLSILSLWVWPGATLVAANAKLADQSSTGKLPVVTATIRPLHSLMASLMKGVTEPGLLLDGANSVHGYALKPSDAAQIARSDLIVQVGEPLEGFLEKAFAAVAPEATLVAVADLQESKRLHTREFGKNGFSDFRLLSEDNNNQRYDAHVWLDPGNAISWIEPLTNSLIAIDPSRAGLYRSNARALSQSLDQLQNEVQRLLSELHGREFLVQHDSLQYLEQRYGVIAAGSFYDSQEERIGVASMRQIQKRVRTGDIRCILSEPGHDHSLNQRLPRLQTRDSPALDILEIDILGTRLAPGPELYPELMLSLAKQLVQCLTD